MNRFLQIRWPFIFGALIVLVFVGCNSGVAPWSVRTALSDRGQPETAGKVAIPFLLTVKFTQDQGEETWQSASLTDRFATGLMRKGYTIVDRGYIQKMMLENEMSPTDIFNEDKSMEIAKLVEADTVVLGTLTIIEMKDGRIQDHKLNIRGVSVADGVVVFSLSVVDTTQFKYLHAEQLIDVAIDELDSGGIDTVGMEDGTKGTDESTSELAGDLETEVDATSDISVEAEAVVDADNTNGVASDDENFDEETPTEEEQSEESLAEEIAGEENSSLFQDVDNSSDK